MSNPNGTVSKHYQICQEQVKFLMSMCYRLICVQHIRTVVLIMIFWVVYAGKVTCAKFGPDARYLAVGSMDRNLRMFGLPGDNDPAPPNEWIFWGVLKCKTSGLCLRKHLLVFSTQQIGMNYLASLEYLKQKLNLLSYLIEVADRFWFCQVSTVYSMFLTVYLRCT